MYGRKPVLTCRRAGSTQRVSAMTATDAVTVSPKRCTVGDTVANAFSGTPSPSDVPEGTIGTTAPAGAAAASAIATIAAATTGIGLTRPLRATSGERRPSGETPRAHRLRHGTSARPARRRAT